MDYIQIVEIIYILYLYLYKVKQLQNNN